MNINHIFPRVIGLAPAADALAGTVYTDIVNIKHSRDIQFVVVVGAGAIGTSTLTIEMVDDVTGTNPVAIPFVVQATAAGSDVYGDIQQVAATGYTTIAGANKIIVADVSGDDFAQYEDKKYVRMKSVEVVNDPVAASILIDFPHPFYAKAINETALV